MVPGRPQAHHQCMDVLLILGPLTLGCLAVAIFVGLKAAAPEATTGGRVGLGILAVIFGILAAAVAFVAYFLWSFSNSFTF